MRRPTAASAPSIPLFPFQAVLCATMGSLILILVVISSRVPEDGAAQDISAAENTGGGPALVSPAASPEPATDAEKAKQADEDIAAERELLAWQVEQLKESRQKTEAQLNEARLKLSGAEEHLRSLRDRWETLRATAANLTKQGEDRKQAFQQDKAKLEAELAAAVQKVDEARKRAAQRPQSYAIIPYEGPNKTSRRPIYIECRADRVILQPEGIVLRPQDFLGPPGPGNPLASALRAARECIGETDRAAIVKQGEPYPLLLVRPDGIEAYYIARQAMASWGSEFGYEFIEQDWPLTFPPANAQMAEVEQRAVDEARERLKAYRVAAAPRVAAARKPREVYRLSPTGGGVIREGGGAAPSLDQERASPWDPDSATASASSGSGHRGSGGAASGNSTTSGGSGSVGRGGETLGPRMSGMSGGSGDGFLPSGTTASAAPIGTGPGGNSILGMGPSAETTSGQPGANSGGLLSSGSGSGGSSGAEPSGVANGAGGSIYGRNHALGDGNGHGATGSGGVGLGGAPGGVSGENATSGSSLAGPNQSGGAGPGGLGSVPGNSSEIGSVMPSGGNGTGNSPGGPALGNAAGGASTGNTQWPSGAAAGSTVGSTVGSGQYAASGQPNAASGQPSGHGADAASADSGAVGGASGKHGSGGSTSSQPHSMNGNSSGRASSGGGSSSGAGPVGGSPSAIRGPIEGLYTPGASSDSPGGVQFSQIHGADNLASKLPGDSRPARKLNSLADTRGQNWGLPGSSTGLNPLTRPIRVECRGDRLTILPEQGEVGGAVVWLKPRTEDSIDEFVTQIRRQMRGWGIAGARMYWRPLLILEIGPSGEGRFTELKSLLENSGFDVLRK